MGHLARGRIIAGLEGRYTVERQLSRTGGRMFFARDAARRAVVVEELHVSEIGDWGEIERLLGDARSLGDVKHALVPPLVETFATDGERAVPASELTEAFVARDERSDGAIAMPSLFVVRAFVVGESLADAIARRRSFSPAEVERVVRSLLAVIEHLHALVPPLVRLSPEATAIVIDGSGDAHPTRFVGPLRRAIGDTGGVTSGPKVAEVEDLRAVGMLALAAIMHVVPADLPRDAATGGAAFDSIPASLPARLRTTLAALADGTITSVPEARRALDGAQAVARAPQGKMKAKIAVAILASLATHGALIAFGVFLVRHHKPRHPIMSASHPMSHPAWSLRASQVANQPAAPVPVTPVPVVAPLRVEWTGSLVEPTPSLARGTPCAVAVKVAPSGDGDACAVTVACGDELVLPSYATRCRFIETQRADGFVYRPLIGSPSAPDVFTSGDAVVIAPSTPTRKAAREDRAREPADPLRRPHGAGRRRTFRCRSEVRRHGRRRDRRHISQNGRALHVRHGAGGHTDRQLRGRRQMRRQDVVFEPRGRLRDAKWANRSSPTAIRPPSTGRRRSNGKPRAFST